MFGRGNVNLMGDIWITTAMRLNSGGVWFNIAHGKRETALESMEIRMGVNAKVGALGSDCFFPYWSYPAIFPGCFIFVGVIAPVSRTGERISQPVIKTMGNDGSRHGGSFNFTGALFMKMHRDAPSHFR